MVFFFRALRPFSSCHVWCLWFPGWFLRAGSAVGDTGSGGGRCDQSQEELEVCCRCEVVVVELNGSISFKRSYYWIFEQQWGEEKPAHFFFCKLLTNIDVVAGFCQHFCVHLCIVPIYKMQLAIHCNIVYYLSLFSFVKHSWGLETHSWALRFLSSIFRSDFGHTVI